MYCIGGMHTARREGRSKAEEYPAPEGKLKHSQELSTLLVKKLQSVISYFVIRYVLQYVASVDFS